MNKTPNPNRADDQQTQSLTASITGELRERVKELRCLYAATSVFSDENLDVDAAMQEIVSILPGSWQFTESASARIVLEGTEYRTADFKTGADVLSSPVFVNGKEAGVIEVVYFEPRPEADEGPFLSQERELIDNLAKKTGHYLERRIFREMSKAASERLRATLYSIGDAVIATDAEGRIVQMNPVAEQLTGWSEADARGQAADDTFHIINEQTRATVDSPIQRVLRDGAIVGLANHTLLISRDGTERPIADSGAPIIDRQGRITGVVLVFRDQSAEYAAEQSLRESELRFQNIIERTPVPMCYVNAAGEFTYSNARFVQTFGYTKDMVANLDDWWRRAYPDPEYRAWVLATWNAAVEKAATGHTDIEPIEYTVTCKNGEQRVIEISGVTIGDDFLATFFDLTERRRSEQAVKESEENLRLLFETMPQGWAEHRMVFDEHDKPVDFVFLTVNTAFETLTGLSRQDIIGKKVSDIIPGVQTAESNLIERYGQVVLTGEEQKFEAYFESTDAWYAITAFRRKSGQFITMFEDITVKKKNEQRIKEEELKISTFLDNTEDLVTVVDGGGVLRYVNQTARKVFGLAPEEAIGTMAFDYVYPDDRAVTQENFAQWLQDKVSSASFENRQVSTDGSVRYMLWTIMPKYDENGDIESTWSIARDITERKRYEDELRNAKDLLEVRVEERTRELAKNKQLLEETGRLARLGGWELDLRSNELSWTDVVREIHEVPMNYMPDVESGISFYAPEAVPVITEAVQKASEEGRSFDLELPLITARNNNIWVRVIGRARRDENGEIVGVEGVFQDVTAAKLARDELRQHRDHLEELVQQRTLDLADAVSNLARSNKELEQFAYVASHDLQEPLRMVASYTELLAERYEGQLDQKADKYIKYAVDGAKRMQRLINDLLALSRVNTRGNPFEPTDVSMVVGDVLQSLEKAAQETGADIRVGPLPTVSGDKTQLNQLFQNLISNAIKYHGDAPPVVDISARRENDQWVFAVQDNGIGVDRQFFERIFVIFQRLHERDQYPGTGIGLTVAKKIVERHGGRMWVESEPGQGATFLFTLT